MDILKQLPDKCIDLVVTSPPYNLNITYNSYVDNLPYEQYLLWCKGWIGECNRILKNSGRIAINIPIETNLNGKKFVCNDYMNILKSFGLIETAFILWDKQNVTSRTAWGSFCSPSNPNIIQPMECI
jgi:site-specific DNA-methyltransferase (adenine-specific)